jgi:PAS domain S-box-containing protein
MSCTPDPVSIPEAHGQNPAPAGSEERFKAFIDGCPSMMWETDAQGNILFLNQACLKFLGIKPEEVRNCAWQSLIHPGDVAEFESKYSSAIKQHVPFSTEARVRKADGQWRLLGSRAQPNFSASGEYEGHIGLSADITQRIQIEQDRQFELSLIRSIHDETIEGILVVNEAGEIVSHNRRFLEIWKISDKEAGSQWPDSRAGAPNLPLLLAAAEQVEDREAFLARTLALYKHPDEKDHCEVILKDGRTLERHSTGLRDPEGRYLGRVWFYRDVTDQKRAEANLQNAKMLADQANRRLLAKRLILENERKMLRALIDNIPDFIYVKDVESRFVLANRFLAHEVGVEKPEQLLGRTDFDFYPPELAQGFFEDEQNVIRSRQPLCNREEKGLDRAGNELDVLTTKVPIYDSEGHLLGIAGVGRDITARKKTETALREAESKYRGIIDNAIVGIYQSTPEGRFLSVNPAMASIFGYDSPTEMITRVTDISRQLFVDPNRRMEVLLAARESGGVVRNFESEFYHKDGSKIWLCHSLHIISQEGMQDRYEGMYEDISERNQLRVQLLQAQKLESVGQLAAGIAHEINTPTQYIGDNVRFLKDAFRDLKGLLGDYEALLSTAQSGALSSRAIQQTEAAVEQVDTGYLLEEIPKAIDQTLEGVTRVAALVKAMKEFSHPDTKEKTPSDLNHAIQSTITVARNEWKYVADVETVFDASLPPIPCLLGEFNQVILNLIVNAAHAIADASPQGGAEKGKITVQTLHCPQWAEIRIKDTGSGIPEKIRTRIFDPFFTTKEIGKGTGQGLAIARSVIVGKHGGTIHFETEEGKGTTFVIRLPRDGKALGSKAVAA